MQANLGRIGKGFRYLELRSRLGLGIRAAKPVEKDRRRGIAGKAAEKSYARNQFIAKFPQASASVRGLGAGRAIHERNAGERDRVPGDAVIVIEIEPERRGANEKLESQIE